MILLSAVSPRLSFANELFIHLHHNVISHIWNGLKILRICRWKTVEVELQYIAGSSPHTLRAHICCRGLCKSSASHHALAASCRQRRPSLWIDSKGGIFSWLHENGGLNQLFTVVYLNSTVYFIFFKYKVSTWFPERKKRYK